MTNSLGMHEDLTESSLEVSFETYKFDDDCKCVTDLFSCACVVRTCRARSDNLSCIGQQTGVVEPRMCSGARAQ